MAIDPQKLFLPLGIGAAVISVYLLFRNTNPGAVQVTYPNPSSAGVSQAQTSGGSIQPVSYNVAPTPALGPATIISLGGAQAPGGYGHSYTINKRGIPQDASLTDPLSANPAGKQRTSPPPYLAQNFVRLFGSPKPVMKSDCGCGGSCESKKNSCNKCPSGSNNYGDGRGATMLASSRGAQIDHTNSAVLEDTAASINSYLLLQSGGSELPTLTSNPRDGAL